MKKTLLLAAAVILQLTLFPMLTVKGVSFQASLVALVLLLFFERDQRKVWLAAVLAGLALDAFSGAPFGAFLLSFTVAIGLSEGLAIFLPRENIVHFCIFVLFATLWFWGALWVFLKLVSPAAFVLAPAMILFSAAYNIGGAALCYYAFKRWITS